MQGLLPLQETDRQGNTGGGQETMGAEHGALLTWGKNAKTSKLGEAWNILPHRICSEGTNLAHTLILTGWLASRTVRE